MWQTFGHDRAVAVLQRGIESGRLSHSYLIAGPSQVGKTTLAIDLARAVNCDSDQRPCSECRQCHRISSQLHPDVRIVGLETARSGRLRTLISIEQVREVQRETSLLPYEGRSRVLIFENAELFSEEAANSLLKTLEEPPDRVLLLLLATDVGAVLPTIVSRCRLIQLRPVPSASIAEFLSRDSNVSADDARHIAGLAAGRLGWAVRAAEDSRIVDQLSSVLNTIETVVQSSVTDRFDYAASLAGRFPNDRKGVFAELELWLSWWRDVLLVNQDKLHLASNVAGLRSLSAVAGQLSTATVTGAIRTVMRTSFLLERNVTPRLALEGMMLDLPMAQIETGEVSVAG